MLAVDRFIAAPPSVVWSVLVDLDKWPIWGPTVSGASLDHPYTSLESGVTGSVRTSLGVSAPFTITEFEPGRHWAWRVAGIPATHHRVEPADGGARASMSAPLWAAPYLSVCAIALRRIEAIATAGP
ncbi:SRPBCC family protein [Mycobacterium sp.]|uniref:SRPBCC family protein n=1 Tax=Mycobacterium sp. TaxID=1785 RepID=UPI0025F361A8|nr:SRPBCC family protein [Mycobacterium sp.]